MIGSWDNRGCLWALMPLAQRLYETANANTGFADLYNDPNIGTHVTGTMANMDSSHGYRYNGGKPYYIGDGNNDAIITNFAPQHSDNENYTMVFAFTFTEHTVLQFLAHQTIDANNTVFVSIDLNERVNFTLYENAYKGRAVATTPLVDGQDYIIEVSQDGDQLAIMINGVKETLLVDTTVTPISGTYPAMELIGESVPMYGGFICKCHGIWYFDYTRSESDALNFYNLGMGQGGLLGTDNGDGTMSLADNRIGLFNPYNNIFSLIGSADPRTSDANTGNALMYNGESSGGLITGTMVNCGAGEGFIAKNGSIPAHYRGNGVDAEIQTSNTTFTVDGDSIDYFNLRFEVDSIGANEVMCGVFESSDSSNWWIGITSTSKMRISWNIAGIFINFDSTQVMLPNTIYDVSVLRVAGTQYMWIDGVLETTIISGNTPTIPTTLHTFPDYSILGRRNSANFSKSKLYSFSHYSDSKSESFVKDQYFSSQNEWQGDLIGSDNGDGTLDLSAEYTYLDAQQTWLEYYNYINAPHDWGCAQTGEFKRQAGVGYTDEAFARWDLSEFASKTVDSVRLITFAESEGAQVASAISNVYEQNKTSLVGVVDPPLFDDFPLFPWDTILSTLNVQNIGTYEYLDGSSLMKNLVQAWIDGTKDAEDGVVIDANFGAIGYYLYLCGIRLGVKVVGGTSKVIIPFHILNYLNQSF